MRLVGVIVLVAGCSFRSPSGSTGDDDGGGDDAAPDARTDAAGQGDPFVPLHVPAGGQAGGTGDLDLTTAVDTGALTIGGSASLPAGVVFDKWPQPGGGELAVLHVRRLRVPSGATVRVHGARALVVVASDRIEIEGVLDGSAQRELPGPGGAGPGVGSGMGRIGVHAGTYRDTGGSGGGFAAPGGSGGSAGGPGCGTLQGPGGGAPYSDPTLTVLVAGSGGGPVYTWGSSCGIRAPGAGGGAIQLSAAGRVSVTGGINVGGGGGGGGRAQKGGEPPCDMSAGAGGGSGGAIVLQSPVVEVTGTLAANGGGGGSGGGDPDGNDVPPEADGKDGQDGQLSATAATGGEDVGEWSSAGGPGGTTGPGAPGLSDDNCNSNGGGGGGAAGRIVVAMPAGPASGLGGTISPAPVRTTY